MDWWLDNWQLDSISTLWLKCLNLVHKKSNILHWLLKRLRCKSLWCHKWHAHIIISMLTLYDMLLLHLHLDLSELPTQELHVGNDGQWPDIPAVPAGAWISHQQHQEIQNEPSRKLRSLVHKMHLKSPCDTVTITILLLNAPIRLNCIAIIIPHYTMHSVMRNCRNKI